jgi:hypothetical protein
LVDDSKIWDVPAEKNKLNDIVLGNLENTAWSHFKDSWEELVASIPIARHPSLGMFLASSFIR